MAAFSVVGAELSDEFLLRRDGNMALIKCRECGKDISNQAMACPQCGYPLRQKTLKRPEGKIQLQSILSMGLIALGLIWGVVNFIGIDQQSPSIIPLILVCAGFLWYLVNRFRIWRLNR